MAVLQDVSLGQDDLQELRERGDQIQLAVRHADGEVVTLDRQFTQLEAEEQAANQELQQLEINRVEASDRYVHLEKCREELRMQVLHLEVKQAESDAELAGVQSELWDAENMKDMGDKSMQRHYVESKRWSGQAQASTTRLVELRRSVGLLRLQVGELGRQLLDNSLKKSGLEMRCIKSELTASNCEQDLQLVKNQEVAAQEALAETGAEEKKSIGQCATAAVEVQTALKSRLDAAQSYQEAHLKTRGSHEWVTADKERVRQSAVLYEEAIKACSNAAGDKHSAQLGINRATMSVRSAHARAQNAMQQAAELAKAKEHADHEVEAALLALTNAEKTQPPDQVLIKALHQRLAKGRAAAEAAKHRLKEVENKRSGAVQQQVDMDRAMQRLVSMDQNASLLHAAHGEHVDESGQRVVQHEGLEKESVDSLDAALAAAAEARKVQRVAAREWLEKASRVQELELHRMKKGRAVQEAEDWSAAVRLEAMKSQTQFSCAKVTEASNKDALQKSEMHLAKLRSQLDLEKGALLQKEVEVVHTAACLRSAKLREDLLLADSADRSEAQVQTLATLVASEEAKHTNLRAEMGRAMDESEELRKELEVDFPVFWQQLRRKSAALHSNYRNVLNKLELNRRHVRAAGAMLKNARTAFEAVESQFSAVRRADYMHGNDTLSSLA